MAPGLWYFNPSAEGSAARFAGTIAQTSGSAVLTGTGTSFLSDFTPGDQITITGGGSGYVQTVTSATSMTLTNASGITTTVSGKAFKGYCPRTFLRSIYWPASYAAGTVATTNGSSTITGTGTSFTAIFSIGSWITINGGDDLRILSINSDTSMTVAWNAANSSNTAATTVSGASFKYKPLIQYACNTPGTGSSGFGTQSAPDLMEYTMTMRYVIQQLGLNTGASRHFFRPYVDANNYVWLAFDDNDYSRVYPLLTSYEQATLTQTSTGLTVSSARGEYMPDPYKINILTAGDSITAGVGYGAGASNLYTYQYQLLPLLKGYYPPVYDGGGTNITLEPTGNQQTGHMETSRFTIYNIGQGSASWMNTLAGNFDWTHHWNEMIYQKIFTLPNPINGRPYILLVWAGTNDIAYDTSQTAAAVWARAVMFITNLRARFSSSQMKVILGTTLGRTGGTTMNTTIDSYNNLIRANALSVGFDAVADLERYTVDNSNSQVGISSTYAAPYLPYKAVTDSYGLAGERSNTSNPYYYDSSSSAWVHPSGNTGANGYSLIDVQWAAAVNQFL